MLGVEGAIVICVSFAVPPPPWDARIPPQLKSNPEHMNALRTLITRGAGQSLMCGLLATRGEGKVRTNRMELYRLDYSAQFSSGTSPLVVAYRSRPNMEAKACGFRAARQRTEGH